MALFKAIVTTGTHTNGVKLEKGMSVDFTSTYSTPLKTNGGKEVIDAFQRVYGVDIKKACAMSSSYIEVKKIS
jgi:peptidoglycan hydrolase-like protein with peptidoglycan-binding domain